jgi:hypothetical protein
MMKQVKQTQVTLETGQVHRAAPGAGGMQFVCGQGTAWITMAEDPTDYILCAGEQLLLAGRRPAVIQALGHLEFDLRSGG